MYPNIEVDNVELAYLNKEIDNVKKQLADRQSKYESVPQPKTQVGWSSYIVNNDRGMLDKYQDAERDWYNKLKDQEHAKELANAQMEQQAAYRMDDNMKNRSLALNKLQYAQAALKNDTSNDPLIKAGLERDVRNAKEELNYWNKAVGLKEVSLEEDNPLKNLPKKEDGSVDVKDDSTTEVKIEDYSSITKIKNKAEKDAILKEMESNPAIKNNKSFKEQYNRIKAITTEDKKAADKDKRKAKWEEAVEHLTGDRYKAWKNTPEGKALVNEFGDGVLGE